MENNPMNNPVNTPGTDESPVTVAPPSTEATQPQVQYNAPNPTYNTPNPAYNDAGYRAAPQGAPQYTPPVAPQYAPQGAPQYIPPVTPQYAPQGAPQYTPPAAPQYAPPVPPQYNPQGAPQYTPPNVPRYTPANTQPYGNPPYVNRGPVVPPSVIYNNSRVGDAPQYHYGNPNPGFFMDQRYYQEQQEKIRIRKEKERGIRSAGNTSGLVLIICMIMSFAFSFLLFIPVLENFYNSGFGAQMIFAIVSSIVVIGGTFFFFNVFLKIRNKKKTIQPQNSIPIYFSAPKGALKTILLIFIGVGGCLIANFISSILMAILYSFGLESTYTPLQEPTGMLEIVLMFVATAIVPPLVEEYSLRGVSMSHLSKHGNAFAILASAYLFGILHGTAAQIPFAFICGLFFGYAVLSTKSLWTGVIIHLINNALSCISSVIFQYVDEEAGNMFFYISTGVFILLGVIALIIYIKLYKKEDAPLLKKEEDDLPLSTKFGKFFTSPAMIVATILYLLSALETLVPTDFTS